MKKFNVTGVCIPGKHYMADISQKVDQIVRLIEQEEYFTINRARQYGKTTTFAAVERRLKDRYHIIRLSFEIVSEESFENNCAFVETFISMAADKMVFTSLNQTLIDQWSSMESWKGADEKSPFDYLSRKITRLCRDSDREILLMIDEVDKSSDNQVFLNFLGMLRNKYLERQEDRDVTFKSVILAGVYDIKNMKLKIRPDAERKYNSPWNIAADFTVDMSFSPDETAAMLQDYENDHHTGMDIRAVSEALYFYTSGYPFLVSRLCKWIDEEGGRIWTAENVREAEKAILKLKNTLFDDLIKNVENNRQLREMILSILYDGVKYGFHLSNPVIEIGAMFGIFCERNHTVAVSNVIFETYLYDYTVSVKALEERRLMEEEQSRFIENGRLDMPRVLRKFQEVMRAEYRREDEAFVERQGQLRRVLDADEAFCHLGRDAVDVLNACAGARIAVKEGEEAIDVCLAIQQMNEEAAQEAAQKERISTLFANIKNLMEKMGWSAEQSMDVLSVSDSDRKALWQLLK